MKWRKWDGTGGRERSFLELGKDDVFYLYDYTARKGFNYSEANQLISNFKMGAKPDNPARLPYRTEAINYFAALLRKTLEKGKIDHYLTWIPPSQSPDDPEYDGRMAEVVIQASKDLKNIHVVDVFYSQKTRVKLHHGGSRSLDGLAQNLEWNSDVDLSKLRDIVVVDDVITTGASFKAVKQKILDRYPKMKVIGLFWAATVNADDE